MAGNPTTFKQKPRIKNGNTAQTDLKLADYMPVQHEDINSGVMTINHISVAQSLCQPVASTPNSTPSDGAYTATCSNYPDFSLTYLDKDGNSHYLIGMKVRVIFTAGITYGSVSGGTYPTLNINGSGAIPLLAQGKTMASGACSAGQSLEFTLIPYGNGVAWDADSNVRESTSDYTIYTDGSITDNTLNLLPFANNNFMPTGYTNYYQYLDKDGYIHAYPTTTDPRGVNYSSTKMHFVLKNGNYKIKIERINGAGTCYFHLFKEDNTMIFERTNPNGIYSFTVNEDTGSVKCAWLSKIYGHAIRVKLYQDGGTDKFTPYATPLIENS